MSAPIKPESLIDAVEIDPLEVGLPPHLCTYQDTSLADILEYERSRRLKPVPGTGIVLAITLGSAFWIAVFQAL